MTKHLWNRGKNERPIRIPLGERVAGHVVTMLMGASALGVYLSRLLRRG